MKWIGVITGDIVGSSEILKAGDRDKLLKVMRDTVDEYNAALKFEEKTPVKLEITRGDSFQIISLYFFTLLDIAILLRSNLIAHSDNGIRWDARVSIGIGKEEYMADSVAESDGEAFHLAGQAFDNLRRNKRLAILTPDEDFNEELLVHSTFADDIISSWTQTQAHDFHFYSIEIIKDNNMTQNEIAVKLKKSPQALHRVLSSAKAQSIMLYIQRFTNKIYKISPSHD